MADRLFEFPIPSSVRGYHVYKDVWKATIGEKLPCWRELNNRHDPFAVAVLRNETTVGHAPRAISAICSSFLRRGGSIHCTVTGKRNYSKDLPQGGVEVPCTLTFKSPNKKLLQRTQTLVEKVHREEKAITGEVTSDQLVSQEIDAPKEKRPKLEEQIEQPNQCGTWVTGLPNNIMLTLHEKSLLIDGHELTDLHINASQALIKAKFPSINGLSSTLAPSSVGGWTANYLQIFHCNGNHWVAVSTMGCAYGEVNIYDSLYKRISEETRTTLNNVFSNSVNYLLPPVQRQEGVKDCGLFAIAFTAYLAHGRDSRLLPNCQFNQSLFHTHLFACFEQKAISEFFLRCNFAHTHCCVSSVMYK